MTGYIVAADVLNAPEKFGKFVTEALIAFNENPEDVDGVFEVRRAMNAVLDFVSEKAIQRVIQSAFPTAVSVEWDVSTDFETNADVVDLRTIHLSDGVSYSAGWMWDVLDDDAASAEEEKWEELLVAFNEHVYNLDFTTIQDGSLTF